MWDWSHTVSFKCIIFFMLILDGKNHAGGRYERFFRDLTTNLLNGDEPRWGVLAWPRIPELNLPSESECEAASAAFFIRLRAFVDGFLQTGIDGSGIETPSSRRVRASADEAPIMTVSADEVPVVIFDEIYESWQRNQPRPLLNGDGTMAIGVSQPRWGNQDPNQFARDTATYYFQELLSSPLWTRIGKCANPTCKRYFLRKRQRKTAIKRGSYCGRCKIDRWSGTDSFKPPAISLNPNILPCPPYARVGWTIAQDENTPGSPGIQVYPSRSKPQKDRRGFVMAKRSRDIFVGRLIRHQPTRPRDCTFHAV